MSETIFYVYIMASKPNAAPLSPFLEQLTDVFRAIVTPYLQWLPPPFNDPIKRPDHTRGWQ
jgi:hypothetical protein